MSIQPPAKRARNGDRPQETPERTFDSSSPFHRSELWFEDGNIIIVCQTTGFRVHRGILAYNSTVFKDMLIVGDANLDCNETFEGCVVARLPDEAHDMHSLLKALYSRKYARKGSVVAFETLLSLFKLSTKYAFDELREELVEHIKPMFPTALQQYYFQEFQALLPADFDAAVAVDLGITYNVPAIVPVACYWTALKDVASLLDGPRSTLCNGTPMQLSRAAERMCLIFREKLTKIIADALDVTQMHSIPWPRDPRVIDCTECEDVSNAERQAIERAYGALEQDLFRFRSSSIRQRLRNGKEPCACCTARLEEFDEEVNHKIWERLPEACGYKNWGAVRAAQAAS
ncbi:hypothetical protein EWM64_g5725 [Hericium alpestre]|uniref:BTB domain-containing protein n=1 Tax=Hericium alpestre TaxID=135208 RepID=A0A4Y9ZW45_9AGAM|nr:hypothetical protein EWM64_g5725 [Hericium alpestre]